MSVALRESSSSGDFHSDELGQSRSSSGGTIAQAELMKNYGALYEIEEDTSSDLFEISNGEALPAIREEYEYEGSLFSFDFHNPCGDDVVYVAVGKTDTSMEALVWTLNHAVGPSTVVFLIHIFPTLRFIPSPLGRLPVSQVNPEQKEIYMIHERSKRMDFLQKFLDVCSVSKVKVDSILIESDMGGKALLDLIPILNIRKLVLGTTKSSLRKLRSGKGNGMADQVLHNAPEYCEVKIICEGKEIVVEYMAESPRGSSVDSPKAPSSSSSGEDKTTDSFGCTCFKPKVEA